MQTSSPAFNCQFTQAPIATMTRLIVSIVAGASITFALFVMMHKLISQDTMIVEQSQPYVSLSSVFSLDESPEIKKTRPKPPPIIEKAPRPQTITPNKNDTNSNFSSFSPPQVKINPGISIGLMKSDSEARPVLRVNPSYPAAEAQKGTEGYVTLQFDVTTTGNVANIQILDAQPKRVFDRAAKQALRKWRYQPKMLNGSPVPMNALKVRLDFALEQP